MVRGALLHAETGQRVLPTRYSGNSLWLPAGESITLALSRPAHALSAGRAELRAERCNTPRGLRPRTHVTVPAGRRTVPLTAPRAGTPQCTTGPRVRGGQRRACR
jgi:hypothetical protein